MTRYFAQNTPRAGLEHMMMSVPGFQKRGGGMMILSRFCYKPEDVDCRYCLHYRRRSCQVRTCPYIAERLKSGAIEYLDLILEYFGHIPHAGLHKRIQAVEHWSGPDQAVLHTVSVHLRSRFADRVWDDAPPGYLAALYLLASKERLWQPALPALSHDSIDFSRIVSKPHGFAIQDYPIFYSARRLYDLKSPMEAEDLAHPKLVSDLDFHNIIYATMIARYGKAVMDASKKISEEHMTYVAAYNSLGFSTAVLGEDRANSAGKRAMQLGREGRLFTADPSSYDGSVPREAMGAMSPLEELAYLKARNAYLEELVAAQKKLRSALEDTTISLNPKV